MLDIKGPALKDGLVKKLESNRRYQEDSLKHTQALLNLVHATEDNREKLEQVLAENARGWLLIASDLRSCLSKEVNYGLIPIVDAWLTHQFQLPTKDERKPRCFSVTTRYEEGCAHIAVQRYATDEKGEVVDLTDGVRHTFLRAWRSGIELQIDEICMVFAFHQSKETLIKSSGVERQWGGDGEPISRYDYHDVRRVCLPREDHEKAPRRL